MKRTLLLLLPFAIACTPQPVEQPLEGQELINKFSGRWEVYNVESGEYEFNYWVIEPSGLCYVACDRGFNEGILVSDTAGYLNGADVRIDAYDEYMGSWESEDHPLGGIKASTGKFQYRISLIATIDGWYANHLDYLGTYVDSLDIWTGGGIYTREGFESTVYSGGVYELHRMKR